MSEEVRAARASQGFTLLEVIVALGILGFGLLALAVMQLQAIREGAAGWDTSQATVIAADQMEEIQRMPWATLTAASGAGWQAPGWINNAGYAQGDIPVQIAARSGAYVQKVYSVAWDVTPVAGSPDLQNVNLEVSWTEANQPNAKPTRTGRPTVTLSSVVRNPGY